MKGGRYASALGPGSADAGATPDSTPIAVTARIRTRIPLSRLTLNLKKFGPHIDEINTGCAGANGSSECAEHHGQRHRGTQDQQPDWFGHLVGSRVGVGPLHCRVHEGIERCHRHGNLQDQKDAIHKAHAISVSGRRQKRRLRVTLMGDSESSGRSVRAWQRRPPDYFWVTFLAGAFLAGAFLAGAFLAGAFLATAFLPAAFLPGSSMPTSLAARSPTARVCDATVPRASWVSSTAWSTLSRARAEASSQPAWLRSR